jgi:hypothetical protein
MIQLGKLILPTVLSLDTKKDKITLRLPNYGTQEYIDHSDLFLQFTFIGSCIEIDYYSEDDKILSNIISEELTEIAVGDLKTETFEAIQERALKVLCQFIDNDQQEMLEHFDEL